MGLEKDLEKAMKKNQWVEIVTDFQYHIYGKIKEIENSIVRISPYHYFNVPFSSLGGDKLYFKRIEDESISVKLSKIAIIVPIPEENIDLIEKTAQEIMELREKKAGFKQF